ncbi:MAG: histidinol-phosphatase [Clostridia bacterium]|nr:histidinol-phosphatase [Clostridia bacterium]
MYANYHTHTFRCTHARGTEREYIETAVAAGMKVLGFADHSPYPFEDIHYSGFRMRCAELADYCETLRSLREEYKDVIDIRIGLEAEYYPAHFADLCALADENGVEYFIMGQHFTCNEYDGGEWSNKGYSFRETTDPRCLEKYCSQVCEGIETGRFLYVAHPDLIRFTGDRDVYAEQVDRIITLSKERGMPLEYNLLGLDDGRHYPNPVFWEQAAKRGAKVVLGCDAHDAERLDRPDLEKRAVRYLETLGMAPEKELVLPKRI